MIAPISFLRRFPAILCLLGFIASAFAQTYTVKPTAGANGSISPNTNQSVFAGAFATFTATPAAGYVVDQWSVNGTVETVADGSTSFSDGPVNSNETVSVTFKKAAQSTSWVQRWTQDYLSTSAGTYQNYIDTFDGGGNSYLVQLYTPAATSSNPEILIRELDPYGMQSSFIAVPVPKLSRPTGFAVDRMGDRFLLSNQLSPTNGGTAVLQGWDKTWMPIANLTLPKTFGESTFANGLGLKTDDKNFVYAAESLSESGNSCVYSKYSRLGVQQFSVSAPLYSDYAQFDSWGRCALIGYTLTNGLTTGANAVVFDSETGATVFSQSLTNTSNTQYYFGGGNFDPDGDFFLNTISSTSKGTTSSLAAYGPTFVKLYSSTIPGFAWYGAANSPYQSYVWGSSDIYDSTGQFMALNIYGLIQWNATTYGQAISAFSPRAASGVLQDTQNGLLSIVQWNRDTGNANPMMTLDAPSGWKQGDTTVANLNNYCDCCCCDCYGCVSYMVAMSYLSGYAPTTVNAQTGVSYVLAFRDGASLSTLAVPATVNSGVTFNATVGANVPLTEGEIDLNMSATNGTFSNGLATATDAIGAPEQHIGVAVKPAATNVAENLTLRVQAQGVLRVATVKILPPAISMVTANTAVTAAAATTDPYKVYLNGLAGTGGVAITVTSSNTAVIPNTSATVPANGTIASGSLTVNKVTAQTQVTLTFKSSTGSTVTKLITVSP